MKIVSLSNGKISPNTSKMRQLPSKTKSFIRTKAYRGPRLSAHSFPPCFLAELPQSPSKYSPFSDDPKAFVARTLHVLRRMREDAYISEFQETQAKKQVETNL